MIEWRWPLGARLLLPHAEKQPRVRAGLEGVTSLHCGVFREDAFLENVLPFDQVLGALQAIGLARSGAEDEVYGRSGLALLGNRIQSLGMKVSEPVRVYCPGRLPSAWLTRR